MMREAISNWSEECERDVNSVGYTIEDDLLRCTIDAEIDDLYDGNCLTCYTAGLVTAGLVATIAIVVDTGRPPTNIRNEQLGFKY